MTTLASDPIRAYAAGWDASPDLPSAVLSGIVGDAQHLAGGGYHISIEDNRSGNYSTVRPNDAAPPGNWSRKHATAVDMSMSTSDMVKCWNRVYAVWVDFSDPRRKYFNAINGWNGKGEAERLDFVANTRSVTTRDHQWHTHDETPRKYWNDPVAFAGKLSVWRGETKDQYISRTGAGGSMADAQTIYDMLWKGGTDMGPAVPKAERVTTNNDNSYGNGLTEVLQKVRRDVEKLVANQGKMDVTLTEADLDALADKVGERVAGAVVLDDGNALTDSDLSRVQQVAVSAAKQAMREGVGDKPAAEVSTGPAGNASTPQG